MTDDGPTSPSSRVRRPPPGFLVARVLDTAPAGGRLVRVTLGGPALAAMATPEPAGSVRVLLPEPGGLELPTWTGNEYRLADGRRPVIRTLTPRRFDPTGELVVEVVAHGDGAAAGWAASALAGDEVAVSGPARGYVVAPDAPAFLLAGDETAVPAIAQLLEAIPADREVAVEVEVGTADGVPPLPEHPGATVRWHELPPGSQPGSAFVAAVAGADLSADVRVWVAGEAAAVQRVRRLLFEDRGLTRGRATVRGYWKFGRSASASGDDDA